MTHCFFRNDTEITESAIDEVRTRQRTPVGDLAQQQHIHRQEKDDVPLFCAANHVNLITFLVSLKPAGDNESNSNQRHQQNGDIDHVGFHKALKA